MKYTVVLSPEPSGAVTATAPAFPGLVAEADGRSAVLAIAADLMMDFIEHGEVPIVETPGLIALEVERVLSGRAEDGFDAQIEVVSVTPAASAAA
jgi:hypothetical protein